MCTRSKKGTTLIELVVALAVFAIFLVMAISMAGTALTRTAAEREVLLVQGIFRDASGTIVQDARRAAWPDASSLDSASVSPLYTGSDANPYIIAPLDGSLDDQLAVTVPVLTSTGTSYGMHVYLYSLATAPTGGHYIERDDYTVPAAADTSLGVPFDDWDATSPTVLKSSPVKQPITAILNQLTRVYFVNRGGTVTMVFVATMTSGGVHQVTYSSNLFVRNYGSAVTNPY